MYVPPGYPTPGVIYPVLYLLHGLPGTGAGMFRDLNLLPVLDRLVNAGKIQPMVVIAPSDGPTAATDTEWINSRVIANWRWGTFVDRDLVTWSEQNFAVCEARSGRALGGLSMGGFGAMNDALRSLGDFGAVTLWSPYFISNTPLVDGPTGSAGWRADSPLYSIPTYRSELKQLPLRISFYTSTDDEFEPQDVAFASLLTKDKIPHRFSVQPGSHDDGLWRTNLPPQLEWLSSMLHC